MSDYKRFISYLYCYDNGIKKNNIGYARVETRGEQCKITIHLKLLSLPNTTLDTYLFYRKNNRIIGLLLCPLTVKNSVGDCQVLISSDKVLHSGLPFSMIGGIIISVSPNRILGTEWDDLPILPSIFEPEKASLMAADLEEMEVETQLPEEVNESAAREEMKSSEEAEIEEEIEKPGEKEELTAVDDTSIPVDDILVDDILVNETLLPEEAVLSEENIAATETVPDIPEHLLTISNYLLIDPAYIDHLSAEYNHLKQNSFILHGFDSYRHLILAKWLVNVSLSAAGVSDDSDLTDSDIPDSDMSDFDVFYQLGVPGIYSDREKSVAEQFGFSEFKTTKASPLQYGDFGYWLVPVTF